MSGSHRMLAWTILAIATLAIGATARAEDPPSPPPAPAPAPAPLPAPSAAPADTEDDEPVRLPDVIVEAPRIHAGPGAAAGPEAATTPLRREAPAFDVPAAVTVITSEDVRERRNARSVPDAMLRLPGVMVQKTASGQSSPFLRGFPGYHDLFLIDGVRLNNSTFRSGPNQYWSTVDSYTVGTLEIARGPHSVLYGSDAVGGTVNVLPRRRTSFDPGLHVNGAAHVRGAWGENALSERVETQGNLDRLGWFAGTTVRKFGDLESGGGELPYTGYDERDGDVRFDLRLTPCSEVTVAYQHASQDEVPRTHTTVFAVPFHGTTVGTELRRELDQRRDLLYARYAWWDAGGPAQSGRATVSWQRQDELQDRLRTGAKRDLQGFTVDTFGAAVQFESCTPIGRLTWGGDWYHDEVDSFRRNYVGGVLTSTEVQGPLGDDGAYDLAGVYVQDEIALAGGRLDLIPGLRFAYARAQADRVDNPLVAGSDPATPGNVILVDEDFTSLVGSLRGVWHLDPRWNLYGGVSQAFRAPTLSDLTAFDSTSVVETPATGLSPDEYVQFEVGVKHASSRVAANAALWYTLLDDTIVRSPTGALIDGVPEVRKDNVGDGWMWGFEAEVAWRATPCWMAFGNVSWMDGEVDQFPSSRVTVRKPAQLVKSRRGSLGLPIEPPGGRFWAQAELALAEKADRLSLQNESDTQRIPPGGTPGYAVVNLRAGYAASEHVDLLFAIENLFDEDYRIHGSGINEPGTNLVFGVSAEF